jgi:hypothetical protein
MPKRAYERIRGLLRDKYSDPDGVVCIHEMPASMVGESLPDADRTAAFADIVSADPGAQFQGVHRLASERSPELLESLLRALEGGSAAAPNSLLRFLEDPRVRPALVAAARRAPARELSNFAEPVALAGGEGAVEVLLERLEELLHQPQTFADDAFFNWMTGSLVTIAGGLLRLRADEERAAMVLARVVREHPCAFNRRSAATEVCKALEQSHSGEATRVLESVLAEQLMTADPEMLATTAPILARTSPDQVLARCRDLLTNASSMLRFTVALALQEMDTPRAKAVLLEHLPREPAMRTACGIVAYLGGEASASIRAEIAKRALADESPSLRRDGCALLRDLDPQIARELAQLALTDEPDPLIRKQLGEQLRRAEGG